MSITPPTIFWDDGHDGTWLEALHFLPWTLGLDGSFSNRAFLKARQDAGGDHTNRLSPALCPFFHSPIDSQERQQDHGA